jgi:hypothetical protein
MTDLRANHGKGAKRHYAAPVLTVYGSVRDLTGNNSGLNTGDGNGMAMDVMSDPAAKENIVRVGEHPAGFGLYLFDYKAEFRDAWGHGRKFGVMADEVAAIVPEAVSVQENGYRAVDYAQLGIVLH